MRIETALKQAKLEETKLRRELARKVRAASKLQATLEKVASLKGQIFDLDFYGKVK